MEDDNETFFLQIDPSWDLNETAKSKQQQWGSNAFFCDDDNEDDNCDNEDDNCDNDDDSESDRRILGAC